jgi:hypothetical protein
MLATGLASERYRFLRPGQANAGQTAFHRWLDKSGSACGKKQCHVAAWYLHFNEDGTIQKVQRTTEGVSDFVDRVCKD